MAFKIRRGTNAERITITPAQGELIFTTDTKRLFVGDGTTQGGVAVTDLTAYATTAYVDGKVSDVLGPNVLSTLDTLKELSSAIDNDPSFFQTIRNEISDKINNDNLAALSSGDTYVTKDSTTVSLGQKASQNVTVGPSGIQIVGTGGVTIQGAATAGILIGGGTSGPVSFQSQTLGISYNDLNNKPTIPAAQVNSDWSATTGVAAILNKPTDLATQTYVDNKISDLVNGAGPALDTLKELADALGNDSNFASNLTTALGNKADTSALWDRTTITDNLIPDSDITYDLGSPTNRFKDLYLSNSTIYLGETALSVDPVKGLQVKAEGGGEGFGSTYVEWLDTPILRFGEVDQAHPLLQILQRLKKGDQLKEVPQPYPNSQIGPADFLLTVTGPVVLGTPNAGFVNVDVPVNVSRGSFTTGQSGGTKYYVGYVEFRTNPITDVSQLDDNEGLFDPQTSLDFGNNYIRAVYNGVETNTNLTWKEGTADRVVLNYNSVDDYFIIQTNSSATGRNFIFTDDGKLKLPAGGDIVDSTGTSVLGGGSGLQGIQGIQGIQGGEGMTGLQGLQGLEGYGQQGLQGIQGGEGLQGPAGTPGGNANTGDLTFTGDNIGSTTSIVTIEVDGGEGNREFTFGSDSRSLRAQISMPQGAKLNFGADATALGGPDSNGSTDKIRLWDFQGSNPSGYNYAIGAEGGGIWFSTDVNNGTGGFRFYSQNVEAFKIGDDGVLYVHNTIKPVTSDSIDLGADTNKFRNVYAAGVTQSNQSATTCLVNVDTVVYTATAQYQHAIKIFAMVEGNVDGEGANWHTQACDIIAVRSYNNNTVFVTTYGVTYTSTAAFATFDGQWNATTNRIEITCRPVSTNNNVVVSIHATEITSQD